MIRTSFFHRFRATRALVGAIALAAAGCRTTSPAPTSSATAVTPRSDAAAIQRARADSARYPYTAADVHFMSAMIGHHRQAVVMAGWAPTHGASQSVRTLAERIVNGQQDEIVSMSRWLSDRQQPVPQGTSATMKMMMDGAEHDMPMPGMLTEAQLAQLDAARGPAFDRLFLTFMIQHHRGAVSMVNDLFQTYGAAQNEMVFKFATDVNVDQSTEIARMERMLAALPPG
jgi:uncharacterized protein (DUF305 family)